MQLQYTTAICPNIIITCAILHVEYSLQVLYSGYRFIIHWLDGVWPAPSSCCSALQHEGPTILSSLKWQTSFFQPCPFLEWLSRRFRAWCFQKHKLTALWIITYSIHNSQPFLRDHQWWGQVRQVNYIYIYISYHWRVVSHWVATCNQAWFARMCIYSRGAFLRCQ